MNFLNSSIKISSAIALFTLAQCVHAQVPSNVPSSYRDLYGSLQASLNSFQASIPANTKSPVAYAAQLMTATSENSANLLRNGYFVSVQQEIQAYQALGLTAVTVHINFPTLYAPYYKDQTQYQQMLNFYQSVASEVRGRGMKFIVESQVAKPAYSGNETGPGEYAMNLPWNEYVKGRALNSAVVAQYLRPDYLAVITEPDTEATFSKHPEAGTLIGSMTILKNTLVAVRNMAGSGIKVGAGVGTWMKGWDTFLKAYATTSVSFLDVHIYPVNRDYFTRAVTAADIARNAGKEITVSESWLYKMRESEMIESVNVMKFEQRNVYSFWAPLDAQFNRALISLANYKNFSFISPGWSLYFFTYLNTTSPDVTITNAKQSGAVALATGSFTSTGIDFLNAINNGPDTTAPYVPGAPFTAKQGSGVRVGWNPASDNVGVAGYRVYKNAKLLFTTSLTSYFDSVGRAGSNDNYTIVAFDATKNSSITSTAAKAPAR